MLIGGVVYAPYNIVAPTLRKNFVLPKLAVACLTRSVLGGLGLPLRLYISVVWSAV